MKTNVLMALAIAAVMVLSVNAQPQRMQPYSGKTPNDVRQVMRPEGFTMPVPEGSLTDQQREELKKIRTEQLKERTKTRNLLNEKRAKLETLQTADKPDMKEINKVIDEIATIRAQQMKAQADGRQKVRSLLTEEQRAFYDAHGNDIRKFRAGQANRHGNDRFRGARPERFERPERSGRK